MRVGQGYDVHRLVPGRRLVLGGVEIPGDRGLDGYSDADVVLHALADALLGALALGDIGDHFPPGDPRWKDADSADLLLRVVALVAEAGFRPRQCDLTVVAEWPKVKPHRAAIRRRIAELLGVGERDVSVKATTHERLGAFGREEGIGALALAVVEPIPRDEP